MTSESFENTRKRVIREHKHSIVKSAWNGFKRKGRGLVLIELTNKGDMGHLSYLTLNRLDHRQSRARENDLGYRAMLVEKTSTYCPNSEMLVVVTDGEYERFSVGSRQERQK